MKKKYEPAELEIMWFKMYDIITTSAGELPDDGEDDGGSGNGIGGGYNPGGWT